MQILILQFGLITVTIEFTHSVVVYLMTTPISFIPSNYVLTLSGDGLLDFWTNDYINFYNIFLLWIILGLYFLKGFSQKNSLYIIKSSLSQCEVLISVGTCTKGDTHSFKLMSRILLGTSFFWILGSMHVALNVARDMTLHLTLKLYSYR